jgi:hypothetical protein
MLRTLLALAVVLLVSTPANAYYWSRGYWTVETTDSGICFMSTRWDDGATLTIGYNNAPSFIMIMSDPDWNVPPRMRGRVAVHIDRRFSQVYDIFSTDQHLNTHYPDSAILMLGWGDFSARFFNAFRYGYRMTIDFPRGPDKTVNLEGTNAATSAYIDCVTQTYRGYNPF